MVFYGSPCLVGLCKQITGEGEGRQSCYLSGYKHVFLFNDLYLPSEHRV